MTTHRPTLIVTTTPDRTVSHARGSIWGAGTHLHVTADEFVADRRAGAAPYRLTRLVIPDEHAAIVVGQLAWGATVKRLSHKDPATHARKQAEWLRTLADHIEAAEADTVPDGPDPADLDPGPDPREDESCTP